MRIESINKKKYVLVIVDDYTRFGWVRFLRTKDETLEVIKNFIVMTQRALNATVCYVRTDNGMEFVNKTLTDFFESVGITHNTNKLKAKADIGIFVGYAPTKKAYRIFNKRTRKIQETIHVTFDELSKGMTYVHSNTCLDPNTMPPVPNGAGPEISALQSGLTPSELVNDPTTPIYVSQPEGFEDPEHLTHMYRLKKALYGLKASSTCVDYKFPRGIFINQSKFALEILKKYDFDNSTPIDTPMAERPKLDEDRGGKLIDPTRFCGMVGSLMYLSASRPDIVFALCMCARYQAKPTFKLLNGSFDTLTKPFTWVCGILKESGFALKSFADANYACCQDTRRSTSGSAQFLRDRHVSWSSKKERVLLSQLQRRNTSIWMLRSSPLDAFTTI
nr:hypothetical protein [Tanacetum cinerariifolium]